MDNKYRHIIGQRINILLAEKNIKQKELANFLGITENTISYYCKGTRTPNAEQIIKIASFFNVSTDYLLGQTEIKSTNSTIQDMCRYIKCDDKVLENLRSIYDCYSEFDEYKDNIDILNAIFTDKHFKDLVALIVNFTYESLTVINDASFLLPYSQLIESKHDPAFKKMKSVLSIADEYELALVINKSVENNNKIPKSQKDKYKDDKDKYIDERKHILMDCDICKYNANRTLEKMLDSFDCRKLLNSFKTKEQWLDYLCVSEKELEECKNVRKKAKTLDDLFRVGAISKEEYQRKKDFEKHKRISAFDIMILKDRIQVETEELENLSNSPNTPPAEK